MKSQRYDEIKAHILTPNLKLVSEKVELFRCLIDGVKVGFKNNDLAVDAKLSETINKSLVYADECAFNLEAALSMALLQIQANVDYDVLQETWSVIKEGALIIDEMSIQFSGIKDQLAA